MSNMDDILHFGEYKISYSVSIFQKLQFISSTVNLEKFLSTYINKKFSKYMNEKK